MQSMLERQSTASRIERLEQHLQAAERRAEEIANTQLADAAAAEFDMAVKSMRNAREHVEVATAQAGRLPAGGRDDPRLGSFVTSFADAAAAEIERAEFAERVAREEAEAHARAMQAANTATRHPAPAPTCHPTPSSARNGAGPTGGAGRLPPVTDFRSSGGLPVLPAEHRIPRGPPVADADDAFRMDQHSDQLLAALDMAFGGNRTPWPLPSPTRGMPGSSWAAQTPSFSATATAPTASHFAGSPSAQAAAAKHLMAMLMAEQPGHGADSPLPLSGRSSSGPLPGAQQADSRTPVGTWFPVAESRPSSGRISSSSSCLMPSVPPPARPPGVPVAACPPPPPAKAPSPLDGSFGSPGKGVSTPAKADGICERGVDEEAARKLYHRFGLNSCISFEKFVQLHDSHLPREEPRIRPATGGA